MRKAFYLFLAISPLIFSCSSDNDSAQPTALELATILKSHGWKLTYVTVGGEDATAQFAGYDFTFPDNSEAVATNGANAYHGAWDAVDPDEISFDPSLFLALWLQFNTPENLSAAVNAHWEVLKINDSVIKLRDLNGNANYDYLTFEKNN